MDIKKYLQIVLSGKWLVILTAEVALLVAAIVTLTMTPVYSATATVRVASGNTGGVSYQDVTYSERVVETAVRLLASRPFLQGVIDRLRLAGTPDGLAQQIDVEALPRTELITISASGNSPSQTAAIANTLASLLVEQGPRVYAGPGKSTRDVLAEQLATLSEQIRQDRQRFAEATSALPPQSGVNAGASTQELASRLEAEQRTYTQLLEQLDRARVDEAIRAGSVAIVDPAVEPATPSRPRIPLNLALGALLGVLGGVGLALVTDNLHPTIHAVDDLHSASDHPVLGSLPSHRGSRPAVGELLLTTRVSNQSKVAQEFRRLAGSLMGLADRRYLQHILVAGVTQRMERPWVVAELGVALAQAGKQVILVDADLRNPTLDSAFDLRPGPGLVELIENPGQSDAYIQRTKVPGVSLVRAGGVTDPGLLLSSPALEKVVHALSDKADIVLWNSAPLGVAVDAALLAPKMDGVMLVVTQNRTFLDSFSQAVSQLSQAGATILGVIFKASEQEKSYSRQAWKGKSQLSGKEQAPGSSLPLPKSVFGRAQQGHRIDAAVGSDQDSAAR